MAVANNKRDVQFILRAKNDASAAFDAVAKALEQLEKTQNDVATSSQKTSSTLDAFAKVATTVSTIYNKLSSDADLAAAAFNRQKTALDENKARYQALTQQMQAAQRVQQQMRQQQDAFVGPRRPGEIKQTEQRLKLVERAYNDLSREANRLSGIIEKSEADLHAASFALSEIAGGADNAAAALKRVEQVQQQAAAAAAKAAAEQEKEAAAIERTAAAAQRRSRLTTYRDMRGVASEAHGGWKQAEAEIRQLNNAMRESGQATSDQLAQQARLQATAFANKKAYNEMRVAIEQYRRVLRDNNASTEQVAAAHKRAQAAIATARATMVASTTAIKENSRAARENASANTKASVATRKLDAEMRSLFSNPRRSLSYYQRLRGEVLALITSYAGLYATIRGVHNIIQASMEMQAAESRLNVVTGGNTQQTAQEMVWVREQADRLGFSIQALVAEWSKFAVAAQASGFQMDDTRKIFISVSEAARVLKMDSNQVQRAFVALTQMISKGKVTAEELRQQLGEHIPGAFALMAEAVGVSSAELDKMLEQGQVSSKYLISFADVLDKRFGSQLPNALSTTQAELGRFQTAVTLALNEIANAGVVDAFTEALVRLREMLRSDEAQIWFERIGSALSKVIKLLLELLENLDMIGITLAGLAAAKGIAFFLNLVRQIRLATAALTGAAAATAGLRVAFAGLGGPVGLVVAGLVTVFGYLATRVSETDKNAVGARRSIEKMTYAIKQSKGDVKELGKALKEIELSELEKQLDAVAEKFNESLSEIGSAVFGLISNRLRWSTSRLSLRPLYGEVANLVDEVKVGQITVERFRERLEEIGKADPVLKVLTDRLREQSEEAAAAEIELRKMEATINVKLNGAVSEADRRMLGLSDSMDEVSGSAEDGANAIERYTEAMEKLGERIPALRNRIKFEQDSRKISEELQAAIDAAGDNEELKNAARARADQAMAALRRGFEEAFVKSLPLDNREIMERIIQIESGGNPLARNKTSTAAGLGQFTEGTWLGLFDRVFPELVNESRETKLAMREQVDASRKMLEALTTENQAALVRAGIAPNARNTYLAHFLGAQGAIKMILANPDELAEKIAGEQAARANETVLGGGKTVADVLAWAESRMGGGAPLQSSGWTESETEAAQEAKKYEETLKQINEELDHRIALIDLTKLEQEIYNATVAKGIDLQSEEGQKIAEKVRLLHELEAATKAAEEAEKRVNDLLTLRKELQEQMEFHQEQGNFIAAANIQEQIDGVNERLREAIANALAFYRAMGGEEAEIAIAKLENIENSIAEVGRKTLDAKAINDQFVNGLSSAFDDFFNSMSEGEKAVEAFGNAFRKFAADILRSLAEMILKQALFNAISGGNQYGGVGGFISRLTAGLFHEGGVVGVSGATTLANPDWFQNALRYHTGGIAGLRPNEVPAILEKGEEVLPANDPRHIMNGGGAANVKIINAIDAGDFVSQGLNTDVGQQAILNYVRANSSAFKGALGMG